MMQYMMEFNQWIKYAENHNFLLTVDDYKNLIIGQPYDMVEIDYIEFLYIENGQYYGIESQTEYKAADIYGQIKRRIISTGFILKENKQIGGLDESLTHIEIEFYEIIDRGSKIYLSKDSNGKYLTSGDRDSWSRWILWENLLKMPPIFFL